jgi:hypothetical protein
MGIARQSGHVRHDQRQRDKDQAEQEVAEGADRRSPPEGKLRFAGRPKLADRCALELEPAVRLEPAEGI